MWRRGWSALAHVSGKPALSGGRREALRHGSSTATATMASVNVAQYVARLCGRLLALNPASMGCRSADTPTPPTARSRPPRPPRPHQSSQPRRPFALPTEFVSAYRTRKAPFGFNGLGEFVYRRTYARLKADGATEQWHETVERVVNGAMRMQQRWAAVQGQPWDARAADATARRMYDKIFLMKFLPPGRGEGG